MKSWPKISQDEEIKIGWRRLVNKTFLLPDGKEAEFTIKDGIGAVSCAVIALTEDKKVVIAKQFRPGPEKVMMDLPGGGVDAGEDHETAALRELREETGYTTSDIEYLGYVQKDGYSNATTKYYLAHNCRQTEMQILDDGEFIDVQLITIDQLMYNARHGLMVEAAAVLLAYDRLQKLNQTKESYDEAN